MAALQTLYPEAKPELHFANPYETLIATILSAQCTDKRVNLVTARLFPQYPDAFAMAKLEPEELEPMIRECGLYHNKAKNIVAASRALVEQYDGVVPSTREALMKLPGVGQKIAGVVLLAAFGDD
ncbi:MAG: endonuclease III, partial [Clostridia bacterium]|nr:endonuclease III [Clostridia bacterium]